MSKGRGFEQGRINKEAYEESDEVDLNIAKNMYRASCLVEIYEILIWERIEMEN